MSRIRQLLAMVAGFPGFLRRPLTIDRALGDVRMRMARREERFLNAAKDFIYSNEVSPYRRLLLWAGCDYGDLERAVMREGLEKTLEKLRDEGVFVTLDEFKAKVPIVRRGLTIETRESDFDSTALLGKGIHGSSSGSRSRGTRVAYDWDFIGEEAATEMILHETHGVSRWPLIFWYPSLPSFSGTHNLLMYIRGRRSPDRWFSHLGPEAVPASLRNRLAFEYIVWCSRLFGMKVPRPEPTTLNEAMKVAEWMERNKKTHGASVLMTFASSAVRTVQSALERGIDISGSVIFTGGEPLTEGRASFIESAGGKTFSRYVATETGPIAGSCPLKTEPDDMHVYLDRLALIQMAQETRIGGHVVDSFLLTSLSPSAGKILLNTDMGDFGTVTSKPCGCLFGELGMNLRISGVRSYDKLTGEGMTLLGSELDAVIGELIRDAGGSPDDYQFWEGRDDSEFSKIVIAVSPGVPLGDRELVRGITERLDKKNEGTSITSQVWNQGQTFKIVRDYPRFTKGYKMLPIGARPKESVKKSGVVQ